MISVSDYLAKNKVKKLVHRKGGNNSMNTTQLQKKDGFTIIEVVLVLAIGALIMLLVFLAWPALQRGQRDQARKSDVGLVGTAISTYKTNHKGYLPENTTKLQGTLPDLSQYDNGEITYGTAAPTDLSQMTVVRGKKCNQAGDGISGDSASARQAAILYLIEGDGNADSVMCQDI